MQRKVPMRMCISCRQMRPKRELIRVVCNKEGEIALDATGRADGRGAYVCLDVSCIERAVKIRAFERAFSRKAPERIIEELIAMARDVKKTGE